MDSIKKSKKRDFTVVNNHYLKDKFLSWKAKGLITYIMMLPDDWNLNMRDLQKRSKDGRDSLYSGMKEIIDMGYCLRKAKVKVDNLFNGYCYTVSDTQEFLPHVDIPVTGIQDTDKQEAENPPLINTNEQRTKLPNTNNEHEINSSSLFPELEDKPVHFRNSVFVEINGLEIFESKFKNEIIAGIDILYYFNSVKDWSETKTLAKFKRTPNGWIATARNFMRTDKNENKLKMLKLAEHNTDKDAVEYLNGFEQ